MNYVSRIAGAGEGCLRTGYSLPAETRWIGCNGKDSYKFVRPETRETLDDLLGLRLLISAIEIVANCGQARWGLLMRIMY